MPVPIVYRKTQEASLVSYDYNDIAEGTGVIGFYALASKKDTTQDYHISTNQVFSNDIQTTGAALGTGSFALSGDIDFDLSVFNMPKTVQGTAFANFSFASTSVVGASNCQVYVIVKIRKYSGTTETDLGQAQTETLTSVAGATALKMVLIPISLTKTNFKKGDTLRATYEIWANNAAGINGGWALAHDPQNRAGTTFTPVASYPTQNKVYIPFRLDL